MDCLNLTQIEFLAYEKIGLFISDDNMLFELTKIKDGYDLKNKSEHFQVKKFNEKWWLIVFFKENEFHFDGKNTEKPFRLERNYHGWMHRFEKLLNFNY